MREGIAQTSGFDPAEEVDAASAKLIRALQNVARAGIWFCIVWLPILIALAIGSAIAYVVARAAARWWSRRRPIEFVDVAGSAGE